MTSAALLTSVVAASASPRAPSLVAHGIVKRFGEMVALNDVSLSLTPGTFHALLGENGAGKSTLVKCLMGYYHADAGKILLDGQEVAIKNPKDAQAYGIGMVYQHFTLVSNMSVAENLVLSRAKLPFFMDWKVMHQELREFMARMPFQIDPERPVHSLAAGEKQKLEILKQLYLGSRIIILDEPTSVLTPAESDEVLGLLREMTQSGSISVLMITHKFREVTAFADEVTVLRRGAPAGTGRVSELSPARMAEMMVGSEPPKASSARGEQAPGETFLSLKSIEAIDDKGLPVLRGLSLEVRAGEIVGVAGVSGNGQEQLVEVLAGQRTLSGGEISVRNAPYRPTRAQMRLHKMRCLPEEPLRNACVPTMSVSDNMAFRSYDSPPFTFARWGVRRGALRKVAARFVADFRVKTPSVDAPIGQLSGGNVQRAVLARVLGSEINVLVAANPCFGLDFAAVAEIRTRILEARNAGTAVLLISTDLDEIFALADRIVVMSDGKIVHESKAATADVATLGRHMGGHD